MGVKRPFEESLESSFRHAKELDSGNKLTSFGEAFSSYEVSQANEDRGKEEDDFDRSHLFMGLKNDEKGAVSNLADKEVETSAPLSWVTSSSSEEDAGSGELFYFSLFPEYFPRQTAVQLEDAYSSLLNSSPRKQVPIGPDHQADVPEWNPTVIQTDPGSPNNLVEYNSVQNLAGTCIISLSDSKGPSYSYLEVGQGRRDCDCLDRGSVRCVRQHVKEARDRLREIIGEEKFADLGFYDMGEEEVARKWTEEEQRIFHDVIFFNPVSLSKNFWKQLSVVFPSRTKKELVSYYFNVFMLRRRADQNRSNLLEIDSDDDEWQGDDRILYGVEGENEDSGVESLLDQDAQVSSEDDIPYGNDDDEGSVKDDENDDHNDDNSDDGNSDGDFVGKCDIGAGGEDAIEKHDLGCPITRPLTEKLLNDVNSDCIVHNHIVEDHDAYDYLSTSKTQSCTMGISGSVGVGSDSRESTLKGDFSRYLAGESNESNDGSETSFLLEPCEDAKLWDNSCSTGSVDLLPTCNMIEEIFGPCTSKGNQATDKV